jgi:hypothetical protein
MSTATAHCPPSAADYRELEGAARDFLRWFRVFVGTAAYNEIRADELDALVAVLTKREGYGS